jgi:hypothetical protein
MGKTPKFSASLQPNELAGADQAVALIDTMVSDLMDICRDVLRTNPRADDLFLVLLVQRAFKASCEIAGQPGLADTLIPPLISRMVVRLIRAEDRLKENEK